MVMKPAMKFGYTMASLREENGNQVNQKEQEKLQNSRNSSLVNQFRSVIQHRVGTPHAVGHDHRHHEGAHPALILGGIAQEGLVLRGDFGGGLVPSGGLKQGIETQRALVGHSVRQVNT